CVSSFFFHTCAHPRYLHSFPTRRSSDLLSDSCASRGEYDIDLEPDELDRDLSHAFGASLRPAILDRDIATLDPAEFTQSLHKSGDRKSTRLNSSHVKISYAVFCLKKKNK